MGRQMSNGRIPHVCMVMVKHVAAVNCVWTSSLDAVPQKASWHMSKVEIRSNLSVKFNRLKEHNALQLPGECSSDAPAFRALRAATRAFVSFAQALQSLDNCLQLEPAGVLAIGVLLNLCVLVVFFCVVFGVGF